MSDMLEEMTKDFVDNMQVPLEELAECALINLDGLRAAASGDIQKALGWAQAAAVCKHVIARAEAAAAEDE